MKRSEALLKLQRYYGIRHCMVEGKYITPDQFMSEVLQLVEELGMLPPEVSGKAIPIGYDGRTGKVAAWDTSGRPLRVWETE